MNEQKSNKVAVGVEINLQSEAYRIALQIFAYELWHYSQKRAKKYAINNSLIII